MNRARAFWFVVASGVVAAAVFACVGDSSETNQVTTGGEGQPCAMGDQCLAGLTCVSNTCVRLDGASGGTDGSQPSTDSSTSTDGTTADTGTTSEGGPQDAGAPDARLACGNLVGNTNRLELISGHVAYGVASDCANVYFTWSSQGQGQLMSCPVGGCSNNPTPLWPNENLARAVAADGFNVYWTTADPMAGTIRQAPVNDAGPDGSAITLANAESSPISIAVDETYVYWYDWSTTGCSIMRCNIGGCGGKPTKIADVMGNGFTVGSVAVRNGDVYWTSGYNSGGDQIQWCPKGQVCQTDAGGSAPKVLANVNMPIALTTDSVNVYWSTNGSVQSCQLKGSCGNAWSEIANAQGFVRSVAVDAKYVYWSSDSKNIYYCLKGTDCVGAGTLLTGTGTGPDSLVIDRTSLFWTSNDNSTDGGVWTFNPKPN